MKGVIPINKNGILSVELKTEYTGQLSWRKNKQNYRGTNVELYEFCAE